ncbi:MAG: hypothetical protein RIR70_52 [Pseudomonadota bacterium]
MNVLFCSTNGHLPQSVGGTECNTHETALQLTAQGHRAVVLAALMPTGWLTFWLRARRHLLRDEYPVDQHLGYPVYRVCSPPEALAAICKAQAIDVIVVNQNHRALARAALATGRPCVMYVHCTDFVDLGAHPSLHFISNSTFTAQRLRERYGQPSAVIRPWIEPARYRVTSSRQTVLFVNPHPFKGVDIALALARRRPDIPFLFVESWPMKRAMRAHYRALASHCPNIRWHAPVSDMTRMYRQARILLMPSQWEETWGRVASEAQVSGIPVIATRRAGLPESVGPGGILVEPNSDFEAWHDALSTLWDNAAAYQKFSQAARAYSAREEIAPRMLLSRLMGVLEAAKTSGARDPAVRERCADFSSAVPG